MAMKPKQARFSSSVQSLRSPRAYRIGTQRAVAKCMQTPTAGGGTPWLWRTGMSTALSSSAGSYPIVAARRWPLSAPHAPRASGVNVGWAALPGCCPANHLACGLDGHAICFALSPRVPTRHLLRPRSRRHAYLYRPPLWTLQSVHRKNWAVVVTALSWVRRRLA